MEAEHPFATGVVEDWVVRKLATLLRKPYQPACAMGWHDCSLCGGAKSTANLWLPGRGCVYVAPEMIVHYIQAHDYTPPDEFLAAVKECPRMGSPEYHARLHANGFRTLEELRQDDGGVALDFEAPQHGWLPFRLRGDYGQAFEGRVSHVAYDAPTDLTEGLLRLLAGGGPQEVNWYWEPGSYRLVFVPGGDRVRLSLVVCEAMNAIDGKLVLEHEAPLLGVVRACYRGLCKLEPLLSSLHWHWSFPTERVRQLGEALGQMTPPE